MKFPFIITRKEHEAKVADLEQRLEDIERHFIIKDPETGKVVGTLADKHRRGVKPPRGITMKQLCKWLEQTDGGRKVGEQQRPS